jgi:CRP-like cAMP-binding protein
MYEEILKKSALFQVLSSDLIRLISGLCQRETHLPGAELFEVGQPAHYLYLLERGNVALVIRTEAREEVIIATISTPGEVLAWSALVEPRILTSSAECLAETTLIRLEGQKLEAIFDDHPAEGLAFTRRLTGLIANRLKDTQKRLVNFIS